MRRGMVGDWLLYLSVGYKRFPDILHRIQHGVELVYNAQIPTNIVNYKIATAGAGECECVFRNKNCAPSPAAHQCHSAISLPNGILVVSVSSPSPYLAFSVSCPANLICLAISAKFNFLFRNFHAHTHTAHTRGLRKDLQQSHTLK